MRPSRRDVPSDTAMLRSEAEKLCGLGSITDAGEHVA
jgi:hypothetical protein